MKTQIFFHSTCRLKTFYLTFLKEKENFNNKRTYTGKHLLDYCKNFEHKGTETSSTLYQTRTTKQVWRSRSNQNTFQSMKEKPNCKSFHKDSYIKYQQRNDNNPTLLNDFCFRVTHRAWLSRVKVFTQSLCQPLRKHSAAIFH